MTLDRFEHLTFSSNVILKILLIQFQGPLRLMFAIIQHCLSVIWPKLKNWPNPQQQPRFYADRILNVLDEIHQIDPKFTAMGFINNIQSGISVVGNNISSKNPKNPFLDHSISVAFQNALEERQVNNLINIGNCAIVTIITFLMTLQWPTILCCPRFDTISAKTIMLSLIRYY